MTQVAPTTNMEYSNMESSASAPRAVSAPPRTSSPENLEDKDDDIVKSPTDGTSSVNRGCDQPYFCFIDDSLRAVDDLTPEEKVAQDVKHASRKYWIQASYIGLGAIAGCLVRMILAQLFGEECANPGTVGWLNAGSPLCVTADGMTHQLGGIIFADIPSNMLGSFLMGFFQDGAVLGLAIPMALAWLPAHHPFQGMTTLHNAFKIGFCGSLTTFSSWNSEMVVLIFGTGDNLKSQIAKAILGYIIGTETAMGSFVCGKSAARWAHKYINPELAAEIPYTEQRREEGVHVHYELPDFERRFLTRLDIPSTDGNEIEYQSGDAPVAKTDALEKWRESTESTRRVRHDWLDQLLEIERTVIIAREKVPSYLDAIARDQGWDVDALLQWEMEKTKCMDGRVPTISSVTFTGKVQSVCAFNNSTIKPEDSVWFRLPLASLLLWSFVAILIMLTVTMQSDSSHMVTYRTMAYTMIWAPPGAVLRWYLSTYNGQLTKYPWYPLGTFAANMSGCIVSIILVAIEYRLETRYYPRSDNFWGMGTIRAIRIGFAGCLTTVSTFVAEIHEFMRTKTDHAYPYILSSLGSACVSCCIVYGIVVTIMPLFF